MAISRFARKYSRYSHINLSRSSGCFGETLPADIDGSRVGESFKFISKSDPSTDNMTHAWAPTQDMINSAKKVYPFRKLSLLSHSDEVSCTQEPPKSKLTHQTLFCDFSGLSKLPGSRSSKTSSSSRVDKHREAKILVEIFNCKALCIVSRINHVKWEHSDTPWRTGEAKIEIPRRRNKYFF